MGELVGQIGVLPTTAGGALLLLCLLVMMGVIPTPGEMRRTRADRDRLIDAVFTMTSTLDKILTTQETATHALALISDAVVRREESR